MKSRYSRILSILLALTMLLTLTACGCHCDGDCKCEITDFYAMSDPAADPSPDSQPDAQPVDSATEPPEVHTPKIKNIILIIGDGMGRNHIQAGVLDRGSQYSFQKWTNTSANTDSVNASGTPGILTDSAAAATALATGTLTINSRLGMDHTGKNLETIMDIAAAEGKATGIATTDNLYGATPSGFSAHCVNRNDSVTITRTQLASGVNFLCGLHSSTYDQASYTSMIANSPYYYTKNLNDKNIMSKDQVMLSLNIENGATNSVSLKDVTMVALDYLDQDEDGFVLMVEQAHIDKNSHGNKFPEMLQRMHSLGETVDAIMEWIGDREDTAVIITADHETGGLHVNNTTNYGLTYQGKNGPIYYKWDTTNHTRSNVSVFVYGIKPDFASFDTYKTEYLIKNTDIFRTMKQVLDENSAKKAS